MNRNRLFYTELKEAVKSGNAEFVTCYLDQTDPELIDPLEDSGEPQRDGYNSTVVHSLLYEAVPHTEVLRILLNNGHFYPTGINNDAFYHCLYTGSIEGLQCFYDDRRFTFPSDSLSIVTRLGNKEVVAYLLELLEKDDSFLSAADLHEALIIAQKNNDVDIIDLLMPHVSAHGARVSPSM